jgi:hypothetical protein
MAATEQVPRGASDARPEETRDERPHGRTKKRDGMSAKAQFDFAWVDEPEPEQPKPPATATFDAKRAEAGKRRGMSAAATARADLLAEVRVAMEALAMSRATRTADIDDAQRWLVAHGHTSADLGNAAGSLFKCGPWELTGEWVASERVSSNRRRFQRWRLK